MLLSHLFPLYAFPTCQSDFADFTIVFVHIFYRFSLLINITLAFYSDVICIRISQFLAAQCS